MYDDKTLGGDLSFRRGNTWVSEIDLCLAKNECMSLMKELIVDQSIKGSDHAPLCVILDIANVQQN